jgi:hypothetical protein
MKKQVSDVASKGPSEEERKLSLSKMAAGDFLFFSHPLPEVFDDKNNDIKPFYKVSVLGLTFTGRVFEARRLERRHFSASG